MLSHDPHAARACPSSPPCPISSPNPSVFTPDAARYRRQASANWAQAPPSHARFHHYTCSTLAHLFGMVREIRASPEHARVITRVAPPPRRRGKDEINHAVLSILFAAFTSLLNLLSRSRLLDFEKSNLTRAWWHTNDSGERFRSTPSPTELVDDTYDLAASIWLPF